MQGELKRISDDLKSEVEMLQDKLSKSEDDCRVLMEKYIIEKEALDKKVCDT